MEIALYGCIGAMLAMGYVAALAWNVRLYASASDATSSVLLHFIRVGLICAALVGLARAGSRPLLMAIAAFACIHPLAVAATRRIA